MSSKINSIKKAIRDATPKYHPDRDQVFVFYSSQAADEKTWVAMLEWRQRWPDVNLCEGFREYHHAMVIRPIAKPNQPDVWPTYWQSFTDEVKAMHGEIKGMPPMIHTISIP
jgi:hypothetical protein